MKRCRPLIALVAGTALGLAAFAVSAAPAPTVTLTGIGTRDGAGTLQMSTSTINIGNNRALLITGYLADIGGRDVGRSGRVILESSVDQSQWAVPFVTRLWGAKLALQTATTAKLDSAVATSLNDAGFLASADSYTMPPGDYTVKSVVAIFGSATVLTVPVTEQMTVTIPATRSTTSMSLSDSTGANVPFTPKVSSSSGDVRLDAYGVQRSGIYKLLAPGYDKWGAAGVATEFTLDYQRPVVKVEISNPAAAGFEGFPKGFQLVNTLTGENMTGATTGEVSIASGTPTSVAINGTTIAPNATATVALAEAPATIGTGSVYSARSSSIGGDATVNVFVQRADAPDLQFLIANWDPDKGIAVAPTRSTFAVGVEPATVAVSRMSGSKCAQIYDGDAVGLKFGAETVYCALRWTSKPPGLNTASPSPWLTGRFSVPGSYNAEYETGVVWTDPVTKQMVFARAATRSLPLEARLPGPPVITFVPDRSVYLASAPNPRTFAGTGLAGGVQVTSPYAGMQVKIIPDVGDVIDASTTSTRFYRPMIFADSVVGTPRTVRVEANYPAAPTVIYSADFTLDVIPRRQMLALATPALAVNTSPLTIDAKFGSMISTTAFAYEQTTQGRWSIQLHMLDSKGIPQPVGSPVSSIAPDGSLQLDAGMQPAGLKIFTAIATQIDAPAGTPNIVRGRNFAVNVRDGTPINVYTRTTPTISNGPSPFLAALGVLPENRARLIDIGVVRYDYSDDGVNYQPLLAADSSPMAAPMLLFISQTLTGNTRKFVRATVTNRWSGAETVASATELESFLVPGIKVTAPRFTMIDHAITVDATVTDVDPATLAYKWIVKYGKYDTAPTIINGGQSLTIAPSKVTPEFLVELEAKEATAPDNPRATRRATALIGVLPATLPLPTLTGPTTVETGQTYTWTGAQRSPFPVGTITDIVVKSQFVLPDGTISATNPVTYTLKPGDVNKVRFESWVEGYPSSLIGTDLALKPWSYTWPDFKVITTVLNPYAPARVQFSAGLMTPTLLPTLHGEVITYNFTLPPGAVLVSQKAGVLVADFPTPGTYTANVTASDTRGNSSTVTSQAFIVQPPKPLAFTLTLASGDRWNRPPGPIIARTVSTSVPTGDLVRGVTFYIDGALAGPEVLSGANFNVPSAGTYEVKAVMRTVNGVSAEAIQNITLTDGDNPVCTITKNGDGVTVLWFAASCRVTRGLITKYQWKVNGQPNTVTSTSMSQAAAFIPTTYNVEVTAITDKGQTGGAIYDMATRTSTPVP